MKDIYTFHCHPFELVSRTFEQELETGEVVLNTAMGRNTLLINDGVDKFTEGFTYSPLLCTKEKK